MDSDCGWMASLNTREAISGPSSETALMVLKRKRASKSLQSHEAQLEAPFPVPMALRATNGAARPIGWGISGSIAVELPHSSQNLAEVPEKPWPWKNGTISRLTQAWPEE
jgi:hypothetical protein